MPALKARREDSQEDHALLCENRNTILEESRGESLVGDLEQTAEDHYTKMLADEGCSYALYDTSYRSKRARRGALVFIF